MRVIESLVDNYLIHGDLHIDTTRDLAIKLNVKDGDIDCENERLSNGFPWIRYRWWMEMLIFKLL